MDHIVMLASQSSEMEALIAGSQKMLIRGTADQSLPYGMIKAGDTLYFVTDTSGDHVQASGVVRNVINTDQLTEEESRRMLLDHHYFLRLTPEQMERWGGQPYLVLVEVRHVHPVTPFVIQPAIASQSDWMLVDNIEAIITRFF